MHRHAEDRQDYGTAGPILSADMEDGAGDSSLTRPTKRSSPSVSPDPRNCSSLATSSSSGGQTKWRRGQKKTDGSLSLRRREQNRLAQSRFRAKRRAESVAFHGLSTSEYPQWVGRHSSVSSGSAGATSPTTTYSAGPSTMPTDCHEQFAGPQAPVEEGLVFPPPPWIPSSQGVVPRDPTPYWPPVGQPGAGSSACAAAPTVTGLPRPDWADSSTTTTTTTTAALVPCLHHPHTPPELPIIPHVTLPSYPMTPTSVGPHAGPSESAPLHPHGASPPPAHMFVSSDVLDASSLTGGLPEMAPQVHHRPPPSLPAPPAAHSAVIPREAATTADTKTEVPPTTPWPYPWPPKQRQAP